MWKAINNKHGITSGVPFLDDVAPCLEGVPADVLALIKPPRKRARKEATPPPAPRPAPPPAPPVASHVDEPTSSRVVEPTSSAELFN